MRAFISLLFANMSVFIAFSSAAQTAEEHTSFCYQTSSDSTLANKVGQGNCGALLTGGLLAAWLGGRAEFIPIVMTSTEHQIANLALPLVCRDQASKQVAIRLIQICQCHNPGAQHSVDSNQTEVIAWILAHSAACGAR